MATTTKTPATPATPKARKPAPSLVERTKAQLSAATLKAKINVEELDALASHIAKLKALLA